MWFLEMKAKHCGIRDPLRSDREKSMVKLPLGPFRDSPFLSDTDQTPNTPKMESRSTEEISSLQISKKYEKGPQTDWGCLTIT